MEHPARVIRLELRLDGELPTGRASTPDNERAFAGWLGLIAAIDALATGDRDTAAGASAQPCSNEEEIHDGSVR